MELGQRPLSSGRCSANVLMMIFRCDVQEKGIGECLDKTLMFLASLSHRNMTNGGKSVRFAFLGYKLKEKRRLE